MEWFTDDKINISQWLNDSRDSISSLRCSRNASNIIHTHSIAISNIFPLGLFVESMVNWFFCVFHIFMSLFTLLSSPNSQLIVEKSLHSRLNALAMLRFDFDRAVFHIYDAIAHKGISLLRRVRGKWGKSFFSACDFSSDSFFSFYSAIPRESAEFMILNFWCNGFFFNVNVWENFINLIFLLYSYGFKWALWLKSDKGLQVWEVYWRNSRVNHWVHSPT